MLLNVREIEKRDISLLADYWLNSDADYLKGMGADIEKLPSREGFTEMLNIQIEAPYKEKQSYALVWEYDGLPIGHSNINNIEFGKHAKMHLHLWKSGQRQKGMGSVLLQKSLPFYFSNYELELLKCEPYALNPAPNKTLKKLGFTFVKRYTTIPGSINFEQEVMLWEMTKEEFLTKDYSQQ